MRFEVFKFDERKFNVGKDRTGFYFIGLGKRSLVVNTKASDKVNLSDRE